MKTIKNENINSLNTWAEWMVGSGPSKLDWVWLALSGARYSRPWNGLPGPALVLYFSNICKVSYKDRHMPSLKWASFQDLLKPNQNKKLHNNNNYKKEIITSKTLTYHFSTENHFTFYFCKIRPWHFNFLQISTLSNLQKRNYA